MNFTKLLVLPLLIFALAFSGEQLIGTPAPAWNNAKWINSAPLKLSALKGNIILVRFFMESSCPFCRASAPYLNQFYSKYKDKGLIVIGMYTPKPAPRATSTGTVKRYVDDYGFQFPVAIDDDWQTLNKYWLDRVPDADFTSVTFLIDKKGIIRYIHPGGAYDQKDAANLDKTIEALIHESFNVPPK
jgi:peroxiredoxin